VLVLDLLKHNSSRKAKYWKRLHKTSEAT